MNKPREGKEAFEKLKRLAGEVWELYNKPLITTEDRAKQDIADKEINFNSKLGYFVGYCEGIAEQIIESESK